MEAEVDAALIALIAQGLVEEVEGGYRAAYADVLVQDAPERPGGEFETVHAHHLVLEALGAESALPAQGKHELLNLGRNLRSRPLVRRVAEGAQPLLAGLLIAASPLAECGRRDPAAPAGQTGIAAELVMANPGQAARSSSGGSIMARVLSVRLYWNSLANSHSLTANV